MDGFGPINNKNKHLHTYNLIICPYIHKQTHDYKSKITLDSYA